MTTAIDTHVAAAHATWPSLAFDEAAYRAWLASASPEELARLPSLSAGEVLLCWAAGRGDAEAQRLFELHFMPQVEPALRKFKPDSAFVDEITQRIRMKLLLAKDGGVPAIAKYAFGGSLAGLVRVAAVREAINLRKTDKPAAPVDALEQLAGELDPELRALKTKYAAEFERAFVDAVAALPGRDRHLLRLSMSVGASIDDIARIYNTHRATAARWLNAARDSLGDRTRANLQARLGIHDSEVMSLLRLVRTEAARLMQSIPPGDDEESG
jgi:RNA polymerase sigma-70 factor (ECF subfamily)